MTKPKKVASPYADGRGSKVNPDLAAAMKGKGGPPVRSKVKSKVASQKKTPSRAEKMDAGRPLPKQTKQRKKGS